MFVDETAWRTLTVEERVQALRNQAVTQEILIKVLMQAVERLGVTFTWGDVSDHPDE